MNNLNDNVPEHFQKYDIDALDLKIIGLLQKDGRIAYSIIAKEIGVPETTIRYRVKKLIDENIIFISAFINAEKIEYKHIAYIELEVEPSFYDKFLHDLVQSQNISYVASVTGKFNIMLEYIYQSNEDLLDFINWIKDKNDVKQLDSKIILKIHKAQYPVKVK